MENCHVYYMEQFCDSSMSSTTRVCNKGLDPDQCACFAKRDQLQQYFMKTRRTKVVGKMSGFSDSPTRTFKDYLKFS